MTLRSLVHRFAISVGLAVWLAVVCIILSGCGGRASSPFPARPPVSGAVPVPEPWSFGALAALFMVLVIAYRLRRRR